MTPAQRNRLRRPLLVALAATAAMMAAGMAASASAEPDPASALTAGVGIPTPALPTAPPVAAPAAPGAPAGTTVPPTHRETLDDCMGYWDRETHMSKSEWRMACQRTLNRTDMGNLDQLAPEPAAAGEGAAGRRSVKAGSRRPYRGP